MGKGVDDDDLALLLLDVEVFPTPFSVVVVEEVKVLGAEALLHELLLNRLGHGFVLPCGAPVVQ